MNVVLEIKTYGCHDVVLLADEPSPGQLDYLDLLNMRNTGDISVEAVAEFQARPLLYIVTAEKFESSEHKEKLLDLQCLLASRGERAYLGVLRPGELVVYPVNLDRKILGNSSKKTIKSDSAEAPLFFQNVVNGSLNVDGQPEVSDYVFKTIHELLSESSKRLIEGHGLYHLDVLSFLGRALFFRFLCDRGIVRIHELQFICPDAATPADCFLDIENSVAVCQWLDDTFNGDLLPFSSSYSAVFTHAAEKTGGKIFLHLQAVLKGWKYAGRDAFQLKIDWPDLDFAHIPIGVFSQVYESFSEAWNPQLRQKTSVYYTPQNIARYLVDDAFEGVVNKRNANILDPSCGAGIFLVLAFRKLFAASWESSGRRPSTKTIQSILYNQLCGFDVSESALRLAALSLYITAIELNGSPHPPRSLKFPKPLKDVVLFDHRKPEEIGKSGFVLGSLRSDLPEEFNGRFDLVIGNPPWSRLQGDKKESKAHNSAFTNLTRRILTERGLDEIAKDYKNPDNNPDLPFIWKSMQWAKPGGVVAMVLPGRIFLKQSDPGMRAFNAILQGIEVTGILNGSNLSDTSVWPGMSQPFMLFFSRNRVATENHRFNYVTPHFERSLNDKGRIRIDYQSAQPLTVSEIIHSPRLLKTLAIGTVLDVEVLEKVNALDWPTVKSFWQSEKLYSGRGYDLSPRQLVQGDAAFMSGLPDFILQSGGSFKVDVESLPKFVKSQAHMPRCVELYTPPLLIVPQSPGMSSVTPKSYIFHDSVVFRQSYYGFSAHGYSDSSPIALLHLITHSELFSYFVLLTGSRMGTERRTMTKADLDNFPYPSITGISKKQRQLAIKLSSQLESEKDKPWGNINNFIFDLYGLDKFDRQVIQDTLAVAAPYKKSRERADSSPTKNDRDKFYKELFQLLNPSFAITNESVSIREIKVAKHNLRSPWYFFAISSGHDHTHLPHTTGRECISLIVEEANKTGCSRVIIHEENRLLVGIIGQYRYWTLTRARLCALDILRQHLDTFPVGRD